MRVDSERVSVRDLRRGVWLGRLAMLAIWVAAAAIFGGAGHLSDVTVGCWTPLGLLAGTSILLALRRGAFAGAARRLSPGSLVIEGGVIEVRVQGQRRALRVDDVVNGWTEPEVLQGVETAVLLMRDGTEVRFASPVPDVTEGVLRAAGVAPDQRAVKIRVRPGLSAAGRATSIFITFVAAIMAMACLLVTLVAVLATLRLGAAALIVVVIFGAFTVALGGLVRRFGPALFTTTLSIGTDGVVVERMFRKRLLRRAEIADVVRYADALIFQLRSGEQLSVSASPGAGMTVADRVDEALRVGGLPGSSLERLDRGGRPIPAWIADLRALSRGALGYRQAALARHDLLDVVKDGAAPAERRIAAAVALSGHTDDEARTALRLAADTCVDERLRVVLRGTEAMPEEELAEAITAAVVTR